MKKILFILVTLAMLMPVNVFAAWTITGQMEPVKISRTGIEYYTVKINAISDGADPAAVSLTDYLSDAEMDLLKGSEFIGVETDPGVAPDAVWDVSFISEKGSILLALTGLSVTVTEWNPLTLASRPWFLSTDMDIDIADIGTAADVVVLYLRFKKG